jgi:hypothetical protein
VYLFANISPLFSLIFLQHIDPFGHSSTQAEIFAKMGLFLLSTCRFLIFDNSSGFDAFFLGRIDYQDLNLRKQNKQLQMIWRPSPSMGQTAQIFTEAMFNRTFLSCSFLMTRFTF